jgi:hypothetical protein
MYLNTVVFSNFSRNFLQYLHRFLFGNYFELFSYCENLTYAVLYSNVKQAVMPNLRKYTW